MTMSSERIRLTTLSAFGLLTLSASAQAAGTIGPVFVIAMENHNWTQPSTYTSTQAIFGNAAAPYINSLVTPGNAAAQYVSYASQYHNVNDPNYAVYSASGGEVHPSEPNYLWHEAGTAYGINNDNDPYNTTGTRNTAQATDQNLSGLLQRANIGWKSYQEGTDLLNSSGVNFNNNGTSGGTATLTNTVAPASQYTVPLTSFSGTSATYTNPYNGSHQYNYAGKHNPEIYFDDTSGANGTAAGYDRTSSNVESAHYSPMEQLQTDLTNKTVAPYNFITPDQYNDMHTALTGGFTYKGTAYTGDAANIAQGDNYLSIVVPMIMASDAFQNKNGTIVIWNDECEGDTGATNGQYTSMEIVISKLAKGNAYNSTIAYTHGSDLKTLQELYNVGGTSATGFLGAAAGATDLADLFAANALPNAGATSVPEPASLALLGGGAVAMLRRRRPA